MADNIKENEEEFSKLQQFATEKPAPTPQQPAQMAEASTLQEQPDQPTATQAAAPTTQPLIQQQAAAPITPITQQAAAPIAQQPTPQQLIAQRAAQQAEQRTAQPQMFGQPQQPQPAQPRQTLMTPTTAGQRYRQILQQNVPQAQAVASGLAQVISTPEAEAQKRLADAQQEFQKRIAEAGLDRDEKATKEIFGRIAQLQAGQEISPEDLAKLEAIAKTKEDFGTGEGIRTEDFLSLENYLQAVSQAQEAQEMARLAGDTGTRQTLLRQLVRRPEYTSGQALLDSLLAGGTAPAAQTIQDVRSRLLEQDVLGKAEEQTLKDIEAARTEEQKEIDSAYEDIQKFLDGDEGALSGLESDIRNRIKDEKTRAEELNKDIDKLLQPKVAGKTNTIIGDTKEEQEIIKRLGFTGYAHRLNDVAPEYRTALIQKLKEDVTEQTVTSAEELAKLNALYKIADITGREAPRLAVAEGEDLGTLAEQKAQINFGDLEAARKQTDTLQTAARESTKEQLRTTDINYDSKPYGYAKARKATKNTMTAVNDLTSGLKEMTERGWRAKPIDEGELNGVIKELERQNENLAKNFLKLGREGSARHLRTVKPTASEISNQVKNLALNYFTKKAGILLDTSKFSRRLGATPLGEIQNIVEINPREFKNVKDIDNAIKAIQEKQNTIEEEMARVSEIRRKQSPGSPKPTGGFFQFGSSEHATKVFNDAVKELKGFKEYATKVARFEQLKTNLELKV